jgi:hypothetical protein
VFLDSALAGRVRQPPRRMYGLLAVWQVADIREESGAQRVAGPRHLTRREFRKFMEFFTAVNG